MRWVTCRNELGELHDAVVAEGWLRAAAADGWPRNRVTAGLAAGLLVARQQTEAEQRRADWLPRWKQARRRRYTRWLA
jgi:CHAD domain-containing protein